VTSLALQLFPPSGKVTGTDVLHELGCNAKDDRALTAHRLVSLREGLLTV
jgi:hypothetical protein